MKCHLCGGEVPVFGCVLWCNDCIEEFLAGPESMNQFTARKKEETLAKLRGMGEGSAV